MEFTTLSAQIRDSAGLDGIRIDGADADGSGVLKKILMMSGTCGLQGAGADNLPAGRARLMMLLETPRDRS